jgi:hypothetical protein
MQKMRTSKEKKNWKMRRPWFVDVCGIGLLLTERVAWPTCNGSTKGLKFIYSGKTFKVSDLTFTFDGRLDDEYIS